MTTFMQRSARYFFVIKAAKEIKKEIEKIEKARPGSLKTLAEAGISIVHTYFNGCSAQERARYRRDLNTLLQMGITADMVLTELVKQMPDLALIIEGKQDYKSSEIQHLERFLLTTE